MESAAERYFLSELANEIGGAQAVVATGYFRSALDPRGDGRLAMFVEAARARGYFLALTAERLFVVQTRAPATSKPLLENKGIQIIPFSCIRGVILDIERFVIESETGTLELQPVVVNKAFPRQGKLLEALVQRFNIRASVASIQSERRRRTWRETALLAAGLAGGLLWAALHHH
jgi:hypothetical protein